MSSASTRDRSRTEPGSEVAGSVSWVGRKGRPGFLRGRRRRLPHLSAGVLLVVGCVGGALWWSDHGRDQVAVLALARPVQLGHVLQPADLRSTQLSASAEVATVAADQATSVLGHPMATSLGSGALLTLDSVGPPAIPPPGYAVAALGLKPGQFPPELAAGTSVMVVVTAPGSTSAGAGQFVVPGSSWRALVVGIAAASADQTVISLQIEATAAGQLAQVPAGQVALLMVSGGDR